METRLKATLHFQCLGARLRFPLPANRTQAMVRHPSATPYACSPYPSFFDGSLTTTKQTTPQPCSSLPHLFTHEQPTRASIVASIVSSEPSKRAVMDCEAGTIAHSKCNRTRVQLRAAQTNLKLHRHFSATS